MLKQGFWFSLRRSSKAFAWIFCALLLLSVVCLFGAASINTPFKDMLAISGLTALLLFLLLCLSGFVWSNYVNFTYVRTRDAFGEANNLDTLRDEQLSDYVPGSAISNLAVSDESANGFLFEVAGMDLRVFDYSYVTGSYMSRDRYEHNYGVATISLSKEYPHLYLDSKANGRERVLYDASQKVQLEGNFNQYFDLYVPDGSQAGALTVFSPDVMARLIDHGRSFDLEINKSSASFIIKDYAFTRKTIAELLQCAAAIGIELHELDRTWQPIRTGNGESFRLRPISVGLASIIFIIGVAVLFAIARLI
jgi:hypothetical protein